VSKVLNEGTVKHRHSDAGETTLGDDLLVGAEAIARELNWKTQDGKWNRRRVYHLAELGNMPIHRVKGLGICARRSALFAFFQSLDARLHGNGPSQ